MSKSRVLYALNTLLMITLMVLEASAAQGGFFVLKQAHRAQRFYQKPSTDAPEMGWIRKRKDGDPQVKLEFINVVEGDIAWWKIRYTSPSGRKIDGYLKAELLEPAEPEIYKLWHGDLLQGGFFELEDSACEVLLKPFEETGLFYANFGSLSSYDAPGVVEGESFSVESGKLLKATGEDVYTVLSSNPRTVKLKRHRDVKTLNEQSIELDDPSALDAEVKFSSAYKVQSRKGLVYSYSCLVGEETEVYIKLVPEEDNKDELFVSVDEPGILNLAKVLSKPYEDFAVTALEDLEPELDEIFKKDGDTYQYPERYFLSSSRDVLRRGLYSLKTVAGDESLKHGPCGSYNYNPDDALDTDRFINPDIFICFMGALQEFRRTHPASKVQWGDISHKERKKWDGHQTHTHGKAIDVRPFRKDGELKGVRVGSEQYDQEATRAFIKVLLKHGAKRVIFTDSEISEAYRHEKKKVRGAHLDHLHIDYEGRCKPVVFEEKYCPRGDF